MKNLSDFLSEYEEFYYHEIEDSYAEMLDECYEPIELAGMTIYASEMRTIDPIMFRCCVADYSSEEYIEYENKYYLKSDYELAIDAHEEYEDNLDEL